jgi:multidrug efflux pump subunit AcrB
MRDIATDQQNGGLKAELVIDRDTASRLGILPQAIDDTLYDAFGQRQVSTIFTQLNQYHVVLEVDPQFSQNPDSLKNIYVHSNSGMQVPLASFSHFQTSNAALAVNHQGQFPVVTLSFNLAPGFRWRGDASDTTDGTGHSSSAQHSHQLQGRPRRFRIHFPRALPDSGCNRHRVHRAGVLRGYIHPDHSFHLPSRAWEPSSPCS